MTEYKAAVTFTPVRLKSRDGIRMCALWRPAGVDDNGSALLTPGSYWNADGMLPE